jgi:hypothetical protein
MIKFTRHSSPLASSNEAPGVLENPSVASRNKAPGVLEKLGRRVEMF